MVANIISIDSISIPLGGILLSDSIHKAVLLGHQIDAGVVVFEHEPSVFYVNTVSGFSNIDEKIKNLFIDFCTQFSNNKNIPTDDIKTGRMNLQIPNSITELMQEEQFLKIHIFQIHDLLNISGYWIIFSKKKDINNITSSLRDSFDAPNLIESLEQAIQNEAQSLSLEEIINDWVRVLDMRDKETKEHANRVAELSFSFAKQYGLRGDELDNIRLGALVHDIGKIVIPNQILHKSSKLSKQDWKIMRLHPELGKYLLLNIEIPDETLKIPLFHHEKWNGKGYPSKLSGTDIPLSARLFTIVDVWDALNSKRPYRKAFPRDNVKKYIVDHAGSSFDPELVEVFIEHIDKSQIDLYPQRMVRKEYFERRKNHINNDRSKKNLEVRSWK